MRGEAVSSTFAVERTQRSRLAGVDLSSVAFSSVFSDHMFSAEFRDGRWSDGQIEPYGPIPLEPSISALNYGVATFEGLKAHRGPDGTPLVFRPRTNALRLQQSAERLAMPPPPEALFLEALRALVRLDHAWFPPADAGALYIRPVLFSVDTSIRVQPAERFKFVVFTFPYSAYYSGFVDITTTERYVRAFPGGTGAAKAAGNYAGSLIAEREARAEGFHSTLWLDGHERRYVEECGVMNPFFVFEDRIVTPPLAGTIMPGVTRDSVITLLRDRGWTVLEEPVAIDDVFRAHDNGTLKECFGTGTAATLSHIGRIRHAGRIIEPPPLEQRKVGRAVREKLVAIMTGREPDPYGWIDKVRLR
jgi:branched-chain amino acid aminotransferase